jgi:predicted transcriptional regulator
MSVRWERVAQTALHPLRLRIIELAAGEDVARFSPSEVAETLGAPLGTVSYHIRQLHHHGLLEAAGTQPRRGAIEHFYRASAELIG